MFDAKRTTLFETSMSKGTNPTEARVQVAIRARPLNQREVTFLSLRSLPPSLNFDPLDRFEIARDRHDSWLTDSSPQIRRQVQRMIFIMLNFSHLRLDNKLRNLLHLISVLIRCDWTIPHLPVR